MTSDALFRGAVKVSQPRDGHRATIDTLLLAAFAAVGRRPSAVVDLGAGSGALSLSLRHLGLGERFLCVELRREAAVLCGENLTRAGAQAEVWCHDLQAGLPPACERQADLVAFNPPYFPPGTGRGTPPSTRGRVGDLAPFLEAARHALGPRGRVCLCYPAAQLELALAAGKRVQLALKRLRFVHAYAGKPARLCLLEFKPGRPGGVRVEPPLVEWIAHGAPSEELARIMNGRGVGPE
ncbi:MAG: methyltransferase [Polyangiaceae bacterium]